MDDLRIADRGATPAKSQAETLAETLAARFVAASPDDANRAALVMTIEAIAAAAERIEALTAKGPLAGALGAETGGANQDGDAQKALDVLANDIVAEEIAKAPVAYFASEEEDAILTLAPDASFAVAVDPLDGSSNIDVNVSVGTIFSVFPRSDDGAAASFFRPGRELSAAGYVVYGPHTALVLSLGDGVDLFVLDRKTREFRLARRTLTIPPDAREFAINASNYRHWSSPVRTFIDDCLEGAEGPSGKNFNMRWVASLVAETHRIFSRGGVFLYPEDDRPGYEKGRLRLIYEAAPIAFLAEQAGGQATDGVAPILDRVPTDLHERTPLVFGASRKVARIAAYHVDPSFIRERSPLFGDRGLFRS